MIRHLFTAAIFVSASQLQADISVTFIEGAPKDRFVLTNTGACAEQNLTVEIDLAPSAAGLIFDTTGAGAGVEVFQPFELVAGSELLDAVPEVTDGMSSVALDITSFPPRAQIAFTVDVDDTMTSSALGQIRVAGSEIAGAMLRVGNSEAAFGTDAQATLPRSKCSA